MGCGELLLGSARVLLKFGLCFGSVWKRFSIFFLIEGPKVFDERVVDILTTQVAISTGGENSEAASLDSQNADV